MKKHHFLLLGVFLLFGGLWLGRTPPPEILPAPAAPAPAIAASPSPQVTESAPASPSTADPQALIDLDKVALMLRDYRTLQKGNPVGTNAEIMQALMGGNPRQATLGPPEGQKLNAQGELLDRWGTPYFFHQLSGTHMEIRSAGPDRKMWTPDDLLQK